MRESSAPSKSSRNHCCYKSKVFFSFLLHILIDGYKLQGARERENKRNEQITASMYNVGWRKNHSVDTSTQSVYVASIRQLLTSRICMTIKKYPKCSFALFVSYSNRTLDKNIDQLKRIVNAFKVLFIAVDSSVSIHLQFFSCVRIKSIVSRSLAFPGILELNKVREFNTWETEKSPSLLIEAIYNESVRLWNDVLCT